MVEERTFYPTVLNVYWFSQYGENRMEFPYKTKDSETKKTRDP